MSKRLSYDLSASERTATSTVVAVRNEEDSILSCIKSLQAQGHRPNQIVISNDDSVDNTERVVRSYAKSEGLTEKEIILLSRGNLDLPRGKAGALHNGILKSANPIIVTTDADCTPPKAWVGNMAALAQSDSIGVVAGLTCIRGETIFDRMQNHDWIYLQSASAALSLSGFPVTAMGNNMAFRKSSYEITGGYPKLPSSVTEDFVLFKSIPQYSGKTAMVVPDAEFKNYTKGADSLTKMYSQRKRWALGGFAGGPLVWALYAMTSATHWSVLVLLILFPLHGASFLGIKIICDRILIGAGLYRLKEKPPDSASFGAFQGWLFFYMTFLPLSLLVNPKVSWKGREF